MSLKRFEALDIRELGLGEGAVGADDEARLHMIATVCGEVPHLFRRIPNRGGDSGMKSCELVQVVLSGDGLAVRENFGASRVMVLGNVLELCEQGQAVITDTLACHPWVTLPVP